LSYLKIYFGIRKKKKNPNLNRPTRGPSTNLAARLAPSQQQPPPALLFSLPNSLSPPSYLSLALSLTLAPIARPHRPAPPLPRVRPKPAEPPMLCSTPAPKAVPPGVPASRQPNTPDARTRHRRPQRPARRVRASRSDPARPFLLHNLFEHRCIRFPPLIPPLPIMSRKQQRH
jgi:hypothetical protein